MKKKVFREKYGIKHDGINFGNKTIIKGETVTINTKEKSKKGGK